MVLFNEAEATLLLDMYLHFRSNPQNLTSGGVLLKMHARDELTRALNRFFKREAPWTESQVTVKFKNLRSEYIELKWLAEQPGFQLDGKGVSDEWWADIKARRPKVHAFKGKLPWPFYKKMAVIVGDPLPAGVTATNVTDARSMQRISQLLAEMAADNANNNKGYSANSTNNGSVDANGNGTYANGHGVHANIPVANTTTNNTNAAPTAPNPFQQQPLVQHQHQHQPTGATKRPRTDAGTGGSATKRPRLQRVAELTPEERERQRSLVQSVEHGSKAAADMARGFNDLVAMFQQQAAKCAHAETTAVSGLSDDSASSDVPEQRAVLVSLAASLEKSAQATAEMAKGYRDLVAFFIHENEDTAP